MSPIRFSPSALKEGRWYEYLIRFALGGAATVFTGLVSSRYGAVIGGVFRSPRVRSLRSSISATSDTGQFRRFSGDCRLADVRLYPAIVQPGSDHKRCAWPALL
jgi:hypothetical protein